MTVCWVQAALTGYRTIPAFAMGDGPTSQTCWMSQCLSLHARTLVHVQRHATLQILGTDLPLWVAKENDVTREMLAPLINAFPKVALGSSPRHCRLCPTCQSATLPSEL